MGLSSSPGGAQWGHFSYSAFRRCLAALDGIEHCADHGCALQYG